MIFNMNVKKLTMKCSSNCIRKEISVCFILKFWAFGIPLYFLHLRFEWSYNKSFFNNALIADGANANSTTNAPEELNNFSRKGVKTIPKLKLFYGTLKIKV